MENVYVYDNGGKTWDRYTVIIKREDEAVYDLYTMSANCQSPQGFNQYNHTFSGVLQFMGIARSSGERVKFEDLPEGVQQAIRHRMTDSLF